MALKHGEVIRTIKGPCFDCDDADGFDCVCRLYEGGQDEPSRSTIEQLAAALGVSPCWLAFGCEEKHDKDF